MGAAERARPDDHCAWTPQRATSREDWENGRPRRRRRLRDSRFPTSGCFRVIRVIRVIRAFVVPTGFNPGLEAREVFSAALSAFAVAAPSASRPMAR